MKANCLFAPLLGGLLLTQFAVAATPQTLAAASVPVGAPEAEFLIQNWTTEDGLPQNTVICIDQTSDGYLWFATYNGLARFDGVKFTVFNSANTPQLPRSSLETMHADQKGRLWIMTQDKLITRYEDGRFVRCTEEAGPFRLMGLEGESPDGRILLYDEPNVGGYYTFEDGRFVAVPTPIGLTAAMLDSLAADRRGYLWAKQGLDWIRTSYHDLNQFVPALAEGRQVTHGVRPSRDGGVWVATSGGLHLLKRGQWTKSLPSPATMDVCTSLTEDLKGNVWIGTWEQGLWRVDESGQFHRYPMTRGKLPEAVRALFLDREGNLWLGTEGSGLFRLKRRLFRTFQAKDGLTGEVVRSVTRDSQNNVWSVNQAGLNRINSTAAATVTPIADESFGWTTFCDRQDRVWVGSYNGEVSFWQNGQRTVCPLQGTNKIGPVTALFEDSHSRIWLGTSGGLHKIDSQPPWLVMPVDGFQSAEVRSITEDNLGRLYLGLNRLGLWRWDGAEWAQLTCAPGLPDYYIQSLCPGREEGVIWIGTDVNGLIRFKADKFFEYPRSASLLPGKISSLAEDEAGFLWLGTNEGIFRIAVNELNEFADGQTDLLNPIRYGKSDGLATAECASGRQPTVCKTTDGRLWFATVKGLSVIDPRSLPRNETPPPVVIERAQLFGARKRSPKANETESLAQLTPNSRFTVPPGNQRLEIHYAGLSYTVPERVRFRYRLEGLDEDWAEAQDRRMVSYQGLSPGEYLFRVIACNSDGVWNTTGATLAFTVQPLLWQTRWFQGGVIAALLALGWFVHRWRVTQLEAVNRLRLRIAGDLHDEIGANLGSIGLNTELLQNDPALTPAQREELADICRLAGQTGSTVRDIVWFTNPDFDNLPDMIRRMREAATLTLAGREHAFAAPPNLDAIRLSIEFRRNAFFMFKEVLHNVVKHSGATHVDIRIRLDPAALHITVSDNGSGFKEPAKSSGTGLKSLRRRAADLGGAIEITSEPGRGTTVAIKVPLERPRRLGWGPRH